MLSRIYSLLTHSSHTRTNLISAPAHAPTSTPHTVRRQAPAAQPSQGQPSQAKTAKLRRDSHWERTDRTPGSHRDCTDRIDTLRSHRLHPRITPRSHRSLSFQIWCRRPSLILIYLSLSLPSSLNLTGFDDFFFVGFCFFCVYLLRNDIIYLFRSWENVRNK